MDLRDTVADSEPTPDFAAEPDVAAVVVAVVVTFFFIHFFSAAVKISMDFGQH